VVPAEAIDRWLDPGRTDGEQALALLAVTEAAALEAYAVSTEVNSVQNNAPSLLEPVSVSDPGAEVAAPATARSEPAPRAGQDRLL